MNLCTVWYFSFFVVFCHPSLSGFLKNRSCESCSLTFEPRSRPQAVASQLVRCPAQKRLTALHCIALPPSTSIFFFLLLLLVHPQHAVNKLALSQDALFNPASANCWKQDFVLKGSVTVIWDIKTDLKVLNVLCCKVCVPVCVHISERERKRELKGGTACTERFQSWPSFLGWKWSRIQQLALANS